MNYPYLFTDDEIGVNHAPKMPCQYEGKSTTSCGYTKTQPRQWTTEEEQWLTQLKKEGWSIGEIANSMGRSVISIQVKLKRLGKRAYSYNIDHVDKKYESNAQFYQYIEPTSILDLYCGLNSYWQGIAQNIPVTTNDINTQSVSIYHEKAELLIHKLYYDGNKYDMIDLDPFGSAFECFDIAVKMAKKGLIITYGELGHKRFKRLDYVRRFYGINSLDDFTIERLISETQKIALRSKKVLMPVIICNWNRISRVYYEIQDVKITEQWNTNN